MPLITRFFVVMGVDVAVAVVVGCCLLMKKERVREKKLVSPFSLEHLKF
jgi:hypothetical protein